MICCAPLGGPHKVCRVINLFLPSISPGKERIEDIRYVAHLRYYQPNKQIYRLTPDMAVPVVRNATDVEKGI